jgi:hypothetical protein
MTSLTALSLGSGLGDTSPASAHNPDANEYLVVYAKHDAECSNQRLFGIVINAESGMTKSSEFLISDCNLAIQTPEMVFNSQLNEYLILYKSIGSIGNKSSVYYCIVDADNYNVSLSPTKLNGDAIADPFKNLAVSFDKQSGNYAMGYQKLNGSGESAITVNYLDAGTKVLKAYSTTIDKTTFTDTNKGPLNTQILFNGSGITCVFELQLNTGAEIWGGNFNSGNGALVNDYYQISPDGATEVYYTNPKVVYSGSTEEMITVYEESYYSDPGGAFILSSNIRLQKIDVQNGTLKGKTNAAIAPLPGSGNTEDKKLPVVLTSSLSNEIIVGYYGIRFAAGTDIYNLYLQRINLHDLASISSSSIPVALSIGKQVLENNHSKSLGFSFNNQNNQFLLSWFAEANKELKSQIWRYDNNPPSNLDISSKEQNENMPTGTTFGILSADDVDPEDASPNYALVGGTGGEDNTFFSIEGTTLKVAKKLNYEESPTRSIKLRATDSHGAFTDRVIPLTIRDVNDAPDNIVLDAPLRVAENNPNFTAPVVVHDEDLNDTHSLVLVAGDSSDNNFNFEILNNQLILKSALNYEDTSMQYVRIRATDIIGASKDKAFAIQVEDINEPIESIYLAEESLPENDPDTFASVIIVDPDKFSDYTINLTPGEGSDDNEFFYPTENKLMPKAPFNYEEKNAYKVRIVAKEGSYSDTTQLIITVADLNDKPDSITLSNNIIMDGRGAGFSIGKFFTYDQDAGDEHAIRLIDGGGIFIVDGNDSLFTRIPLVYDYSVPANNFHTIKIESKDLGGLLIEQNFIIEVVPFSDTEPPVIYNFEKNPRFISDNESVLPLSVSVTDNENLGEIEFYYRGIRSEGDFNKLDAALIETEGNDKFQIVNLSLNIEALDELGIEYYFKVTDAAENVDSTVIGFTYVEYQKMPFSPMSETFNGDLSSYKIIANPFVLESNKVSEIFSDYGLSSKDSWVLYEFRNGKNEPIGTSSANMQFGKGYWFNKMPDVTGGIVFENAKSPAHNRETPFEMTLARGWNLIGNPYPFTLDWNNVLIENTFEPGEIQLHTYNSGYDSKNELKIFEGGFVFVETKMTLTVPVLNNPASARIAYDPRTPFEWIINFNLDNGEVRNQLSGLGMHEEADDSFDKFDTPLLPRLFNYTDISFNHVEHFAEAFTKDIVPIRENNIWEFVASSNSSHRNFNLSWNKPAFRDPEKQLVLYDMLNDIKIDMSKTTVYQINLDQEVPFKAIYGDQNFIDDILSEIRIEALNPYPNPFNDELNMPVILPISKDGYEVVCNVYNLMGEKVFATSEEKAGQGIHNIRWHETTDIKKGIYIYSIKVKSRFLTKEFHGRMVKN